VLCGALDVTFLNRPAAQGSLSTSDHSRASSPAARPNLRPAREDRPPRARCSGSVATHDPALAPQSPETPSRRRATRPRRADARSPPRSARDRTFPHPRPTVLSHDQERVLSLTAMTNCRWPTRMRFAYQSPSRVVGSLSLSLVAGAAFTRARRRFVERSVYTGAF
jgi:hypothetical protein